MVKNNRKRLKGKIVCLLYGDCGYIVGDDGTIYLFFFRDVYYCQAPKVGMRVTFFPLYYTEPEAVEVKILF